MFASTKDSRQQNVGLQVYVLHAFFCTSSGSSRHAMAAILGCCARCCRLSFLLGTWANYTLGYTSILSFLVRWCSDLSPSLEDRKVLKNKGLFEAPCRPFTRKTNDPRIWFRIRGDIQTWKGKKSVLRHNYMDYTTASQHGVRITHDMCKCLFSHDIRWK
jgi:hypothetical protein